jgi:hypothetical protein
MITKSSTLGSEVVYIDSDKKVSKTLQVEV